MWNVFRRWWLNQTASRPPAPPGRSSLPPRPSPLPLHGDLVPAVPAPNIPRAFTARLLGARKLSDAAEPSPAERAVLARLHEAALAPDKAPMVPRLPSVLPKLMRLIRRDDMAARELAELLGREPALLGEVVRLARSPRYLGAHTTLDSVEAAVAVLGQRGIQQVVIRAVMSPVFDRAQGRFSAAAGTLLWDQAERCAHACAFLRAGASDPFEAYLAGMVSNAGLLVALRLLDQQQQPPLPLTPLCSTAFHDQLAASSSIFSARIARHWQFPEPVAQAIDDMAQAEEGARGPVEEGGLAAALRRADRASKAHVLIGLGVPVPPGDNLDAACLDELARAFGPTPVPSSG